MDLVLGWIFFVISLFPFAAAIVIGVALLRH